MKKELLLVFLAIVFAIGCFPIAALAEENSLSPIRYQVMGDKKRADAVASYMMRHGYSAISVVSPGIFGELNGKRWPGVKVARFGAAPDEGIFIPVSDNALKKGLCSDQQELITALPKNNWPTPGTVLPAERTTQVLVPSASSGSGIIPNPCSCGDLPWPAKGIWADFPPGAYGVEVQNRPAEYVWKIKWVVREGDVIRAICCFKNSTIPGLDEMEIRWGNGRKLFLWKDFGGCDGGKHCTVKILIFN